MKIAIPQPLVNTHEMISKIKDQVNEFGADLRQQIASSLQRALTEVDGPRVAAFDADGTLWDADAGETFFDWQIHNCGLKGLPADPWEHYHSLKKQNPVTAYLWLAQINAGHSLSQVQSWAKQCFASHPEWPVFLSQRQLITELKQMGFEVYIVTASIKWAVEPLAPLMGIDPNHVIGITTKIEDGVVGREANPPITWRQGKAEGLLAATKGQRPILACGNTFGDTALIETATHVQMAVSTQNQTCGLFEEESKLQEEAKSRRWLIHHFRTPVGN